MMDLREPAKSTPGEARPAANYPGELRHWPIQLHLITPIAPYFRDSDLLLAADCVAFAMGAFHPELLRGRSLAIACPKLDTGMDRYLEKLTALIDLSGVASITVAIMEVPCCGGLTALALQALERAKRKVPVRKIVIGVSGEILADEVVSC